MPLFLLTKTTTTFEFVFINLLIKYKDQMKKIIKKKQTSQLTKYLNQPTKTEIKKY